MQRVSSFLRARFMAEGFFINVQIILGGPFDFSDNYREKASHPRGREALRMSTYSIYRYGQ